MSDRARVTNRHGLTEAERRALRHAIDAERRRRDPPRVDPDRHGDGLGASIVDRCRNLEPDPLLALDLAVTASTAKKKGRPPT